MVSQYHDENGKFKKGNKAGREKAGIPKSSKIKKMQKEIQVGIIEAVHEMMTTSWQDLKKIVESPDCSQFKYGLANALRRNKMADVFRAIEYAIGKPNNMIPEKGSGEIPVASITRHDGSKVEFRLDNPPVIENENNDDDHETDEIDENKIEVNNDDDQNQEKTSCKNNLNQTELSNTVWKNEGD